MINVSDSYSLADLIRPLHKNTDRVKGDGHSCYEEVAAKGAIYQVTPIDNAQ
jgi:hypothetical protein